MSGSSTSTYAVVTGASSGIGRELASELAKRGFDLLIAAEDAELDAAAAGLRSTGRTVDTCRTDLATREGVEALVERVQSSGRPVDALCLNAGIGVNGSFVDVPLERHLEVIGLDVTGTVHLAHRLLPAMVERGEGRVLITASIAATMPGAYQSTYNASKAFLHSFSEAIRTELRERGVTVTSLMPGPTDTEFFERA